MYKHRKLNYFIFRWTKLLNSMCDTISDCFPSGIFFKHRVAGRPVTLRVCVQGREDPRASISASFEPASLEPEKSHLPIEMYY